MKSKGRSPNAELPLVYVTSLSDASRRKLEALGVFSVQQLYGMVVQGGETRKALARFLGVTDSTLDDIVEECRGVLPRRELSMLEEPVEPGNMPLGALPEGGEDQRDEKSCEED